MKRTNVTYGQLDKTLRSLGFLFQPAQHEPPGRVYKHKASGAVIMLPAVDETDTVFEHHLLSVRLELDNFGIADPTAFADKLRKAG